MSLTPIRPTRRALNGLVLILPWWRRAQEREVQRTAGGEPSFVAPPDEPSSAVRARVQELEKALLAGTLSTNAVLLDPAQADLRPFPLFRELIAKHAREPRAQLTPKGEPGTALTSVLTVLGADGKPRAGLRVYAYHTSSMGWYAAEAPHVSGNSGDWKFARLFGYARTDAEGRCELVGVRPAPYPRTTLPSHIHLAIEDGERTLLVSEVRFEDCTNLTPSEREASLRAGYVVVPVTKNVDGSTRCTAEFRLPPA
jgi:protocatechuate 3,4-dioxygenase beta subunit